MRKYCPRREVKPVQLAHLDRCQQLRQFVLALAVVDTLDSDAAANAVDDRAGGATSGCRRSWRFATPVSHRVNALVALDY
jgi:hypothetical protein